MNMNFPIIGPMRIPLLIMEWIFAFFALEISLIFLIRYLKQERELKNNQELGYFCLFVSLSIMWFLFIVGDYYSSEITQSPFLIWNSGNQRAFFLNLGYFSLMIGAFFFIFFQEKYRIYALRKFFFSLVFGLFILTSLVIFIIDIEFNQIFSMLFWPLFLLFFILYLVDFVKKVQNKERIIIGLTKFLSGFLLLVIGFMMTTDVIIETFGLEIRLLGAILQLISIFLISLFFFSLPPFAEFEWEESMEDLYVIDPAGICLYHHSFVENDSIMDENLISGAISSINIMLEELTEDEGISVIKKKGKTVLIYPGKNVTGVAFSKEDLNYIKLLLRNFIERFEIVYEKVLEDWNGEVNVFQPARTIINEIYKI